MADADALHIGENSQEQVAFKLLYEIANVEGGLHRARALHFINVDPEVGENLFPNAGESAKCAHRRKAQVGPERTWRHKAGNVEAAPAPAQIVGRDPRQQRGKVHGAA